MTINTCCGLCLFHTRVISIVSKNNIITLITSPCCCSRPSAVGTSLFSFSLEALNIPEYSHNYPTGSQAYSLSKFSSPMDCLENIFDGSFAVAVIYQLIRHTCSSISNFRVTDVPNILQGLRTSDVLLVVPIVPIT